MLAATKTVIGGWDVLGALLILFTGIVLEKVAPPHPWIGWLTLFAVAVFGFALTVNW